MTTKQADNTDISKVKTSPLRVKMVIYDGTETTPENPIVQSDEPFYGSYEMMMQARSLTRNLRRHLETEQ
jgi:hypothetical protein